MQLSPQAQAQNPFRQPQSFGKELANLAKLYTGEKKYSGENDNFDFKLVIFHDLCGRADIPNNIKPKAYPSMLRGLAECHWSDSSIGSDISKGGVDRKSHCEHKPSGCEEYRDSSLPASSQSVSKLSSSH